MPDISMCTKLGDTCALSRNCRRHIASGSLPSSMRQVYSAPIHNMDRVCLSHEPLTEDREDLGSLELALLRAASQLLGGYARDIANEGPTAEEGYIQSTALAREMFEAIIGTGAGENDDLVADLLEGLQFYAPDLSDREPYEGGETFEDGWNAGIRDVVVAVVSILQTHGVEESAVKPVLDQV